jgi:hypothetical protein
MRTSKAVFAGLGTTGSMIAGAICVFALASAVVAFNGWPSSSANRNSTMFVAQRSWDLAGLKAVAASAAPAAATVVPTPQGPVVAQAFSTSPGTPASSSSSSAPPANSSFRSTTISRPLTPEISTPDSAFPPLPELPDVSNTTSEVASTVSGTTGSVGKVVQGTTQTVGNVVNGVSKPAGQAVSNVGKTVGQVAQGAGSLVSGLLHHGN